MFWQFCILDFDLTFVSCCCSVAKFYPILLTPWTAACQPSLSFTISQNLLKFVSIESPMLSNQTYGFSSGHVRRWELDHKKVECQRIDTFELWCWRRLLRVPWTARKSNQSILEKINPEYSLEGLMLKPKPQYFGHLLQRADSLEKTHAKKDWRQKEKGAAENEMIR